MRLPIDSALLLVAFVNGAVLSALLASARRNQSANRLLAALVFLVSIRFFPYILGFAGAYDRYRWLTFAPFDLTLAFGPLLWCYVWTLTNGGLPPQWRWHFVPAAAQFTYYAVCFSLPINLKWHWYGGTHLRVIEPIGFLLAVVSSGAYVILAGRGYRRYRRWLLENFSNSEPFELTWMRWLLIAFAGTVVLAMLAWLGNLAFGPFNYFDRLPGVIWLALLAYFLGFGGWRYSDAVYPRRTHTLSPVPANQYLDGIEYRSDETELQTESSGSSQETVAHQVPLRTTRASTDYATMGERWRAQTIAAGWWREDGLTLAALAVYLGTSPRTLSRGLKEGLDQTFNAFVNRIRVDAVLVELGDFTSTRDILSIALDAGFNSKASFNRAFKEFQGVTPSAFRRKAAENQKTARLKLRQHLSLAPTESPLESR